MTSMNLMSNKRISTLELEHSEIGIGTLKKGFIE